MTFLGKKVPNHFLEIFNYQDYSMTFEQISLFHYFSNFRRHPVSICVLVEYAVRVRVKMIKCKLELTQSL